MSSILSLFPAELPVLEPVSGPCVGCQRKPARVRIVRQDPVAEGGAVSSVGLCSSCSCILERVELAQLQAHRVAQLVKIRETREAGGGA